MGKWTVCVGWLFAVFCVVGYADVGYQGKKCEAKLTQSLAFSKPEKAFGGLLMKNIDPESAEVRASTSMENPDYGLFRWLRDEGLALDFIFQTGFEDARPLVPLTRDKTLKLARNYVGTIEVVQDTPSPELDPRGQRYGEVKYYLGKKAFTEPWGRPQNDGPASVTLALLRLAKQELKLQRKIERSDSAEALARSNQILVRLYNTQERTGVIRKYLDYLARSWDQDSFDAWEENKASSHFYTVFRIGVALHHGAVFARLMNDQESAVRYEEALGRIRQQLKLHFNGKFIVSMLGFVHGLAGDKDSGLDLLTIMAFTQSYLDRDLFAGEPLMSLAHPQVLATFHLLESEFRELYEVNQSPRAKKRNLQPLIGRYPEDSYTGYHGEQRARNLANPWNLATSAFGEFCYLLAEELHQKRALEITAADREFFLALFPESDALASRLVEPALKLSENDALFSEIVLRLISKGHGFQKRVLEFMDPDFNLSEQVYRGLDIPEDRKTRHSTPQVGARNLSWSYVQFLATQRTGRRLESIRRYHQNQITKHSAAAARKSASGKEASRQ